MTNYKLVYKVDTDAGITYVFYGKLYSLVRPQKAY